MEAHTNLKKTFCRFVIIPMIIGTIAVSAHAADLENIKIDGMTKDKINYDTLNSEILENDFNWERASGSFDWSIKSGTLMKSNQKLPLAADETVTITASYIPSDASVDFGLLSEDGYFYYINVNKGSIDKTIRVEERGNYMLAVRNNSDDTVSVVGYVND